MARVGSSYPDPTRPDPRETTQPVKKLWSLARIELSIPTFQLFMLVDLRCYYCCALIVALVTKINGLIFCFFFLFSAWNGRRGGFMRKARTLCRGFLMKAWIFPGEMENER